MNPQDSSTPRVLGRLIPASLVRVVVRVAVMAIAVLLLSSPIRAQNLLANGGFESGTASWSTFVPTESQGKGCAFSISSDSPHTGVSGARLQATVAARFSISPTSSVSVQPGRYGVSIWLRAGSDFTCASNQPGFVLRVNQFQTGQSAASTYRYFNWKGESSSNSTFSSFVPPPAQWTRMHAVVDVPTGIDRITVDVFLWNGAGSLFLDDVHVERLPLRLLLPQSRLGAIHALRTTDTLMASLLSRIEANGETCINLPAIQYSTNADTMLSSARGAEGRILTAAFLYRLGGDSRFLDAARRDLLQVSAFTNWLQASAFLATAQMSSGVALGYTWLAEDLTPEDREVIRSAITTKILNYAPVSYDPSGVMTNVNWVAFGSTDKTHNNWNFVCNAGYLSAALALADKQPSLAATVVDGATQSLPLAMAHLDPDGAWLEGPSYWTYATTYLTHSLALLTDAMGTDYNLSASSAGLPGVLGFARQFFGPTGLSFTFGDTGAMSDHESPHDSLVWLSTRYSDSGVSAELRRRLNKRVTMAPTTYEQSLPAGNGWRPFVFSALNFPSSLSSVAAARDAHFGGEADFAALRSAADDANALWVAFKGGANGKSHGHLDLGSFVLEVDGVRWANDLGSDSYALPGYWSAGTGGQRWTYYRLNNRGHNTLTVDDMLQSATASAPVVAFTAGGVSPSVVTDLTAAYPGKSTLLRRGVMLVDRAACLVQDDADGLAAGAVLTWRMHTAATVSLSADARTATLQRSGKTLRAEILSPSGATFSVSAATPPTTAENQNAGISVLKINYISGGGTARLAVRLVPIRAGVSPPPAPSLTPLANWPGM